MANGNNPKLNIGPSKESLSELDRFLRLMKDIQKVTKGTEKDFEDIRGVLAQNAKFLQALKQDTKQLRMVSDATKRSSISQVGVGRYLEGASAQQRSRAQRVADYPELQRLAQEKKQLQELGRAASRMMRTRQRETQSLLAEQKRAAQDEKQQLRDIGKSASLMMKDRKRQFRELAEERKRQEAAIAALERRSDQQNTRRDRFQHNLARKFMQRRLADLRTEERRLEKLNKLRYGDRQMERAEAAAGRRKSMQRLFGDGGASLFGVQAGLLANYAVLNGVRGGATGGVNFTSQLDESLRNLQAITVVTDENLGGLREEILEVSEATKFFATDIADAAVTLGQAGFSVAEIQDSIRAVSLLATATGTDLKRSVDLATSILGVFKMESTQMTGVANTLTAAVNNSKLNIDKLTLGLQYAGNTAAQSGVSFEELTASLGAMANAGIRSGSTLGTGMRQILIALQKPSGNFKDSLDRLGISMQEVDLRTQGLYGVMKNLKEGGFSAGDAIRSFEVRAAAAFNALSGNLDEVVKLERAFLNSSAAMKANETQMRAMANQGRRLTANLQAVVSTGLEPLAYATRDLMSWVADLLQEWRQAPDVLRGVTTGLASLTAGLIAARGAWLLLNVGAMVTGIKALYTTLMSLKAGVALTGFALAPIGVAIAGVTTAVLIGLSAFSRYDRELERINDRLEKAQTNFDNTAGVMEKTASQIGMVDDRIEQLTNRSEMLNGEQSLLQLEADKVREQFYGMGLQIGENVGSTEDLIAALKELRENLQDDYVLNIRGSAVALNHLMDATQNKIETTRQGMLGARNRATQRRATQDPRFLAQMDRGMVSGASLMEMQKARMEGAAIQDLLLSEETTRGERKFMEQMLKDLDTLIQYKQRQLSLEHELNDLRETQRNEEIRSLYDTPTGPVGRVNAFRLSQQARMGKAAASGNGPVEQYGASRAELVKLEEEAAVLRTAVEQHEGLNASVRNELLQVIDNTLAEATLAKNRLAESAMEIAEDAAEAAQIRYDTEQSRLSLAQSKSYNPDEIQSLGSDRIDTLTGRRDADIEALKAGDDFQGDTSSELYKAKLEAIEQNYAEDLEAIRNETNEHLARVSNLRIRELNLQQRQLERQLDQAVTVEDRTEIRDRLAGLAVEVSEEQKRRDALTIEAADVLAQAQADADDATEAALSKLSEDNEKDQIEAAERDLEIAERALDAVEDLARTAMTNKELAEAQQKRAAALAKFAEEANDLAQVKTEAGGGTAEENQEDADNAIDVATRDLDRTFGTAQRRINRKGGGGGNPYKRKRDHIDQFIDELEAKLDVADNYLSAGREVGDEYSNVMESALGKVEEIAGQIDSLQTKMQAGGLSTTEQERLNTLIDQQARMTNFIREEEMHIARLKLEQGDHQAGLLLTTQAWARENLNMAQTLQEGLTGSLTNAKTALAEFFSTWSDGTKSGKEAFRDFAVSVVKSIQNIFAEMLAVYILKKALGWLGGAIGGDFGASLSAAAGNLKEGGDVRHAAAGEHVQGNLNRDSQRYNLMPGEYVLRRSAVQAVGVDELDKINAMGNRTVSNSNHHGMLTTSKTSKGDGTINFYLVDERSQIGALGPKDVIAIVNDDISAGGSTKKLIKSVQTGVV